MESEQSKFFSHRLCTSRINCVDCRCEDARGENFRAAAEKKFGGSVTVCVHGVPMGFKRVDSMPVTAAIVARGRSKGTYDRLPQPIPESAWPCDVRKIGNQRMPGEAGVGDTAKRMLGEAGNKAQVILKMTIGCTCEERRAWLNAIYPYA